MECFWLLYSILYHLIHFNYTVYELNFNIITWIYWKFNNFYRQTFSTKSNKIQHDFTKCRVPNHLTILLGHEEPSYNDLANIIMWCIASHINFISIYDQKGELKRNEHQLAFEVRRKKQKEDCIIWHHSNTSDEFKNGFVGRKIHIKLLTQIDGKLPILNYIKHGARNIGSNGSNINKINDTLRKQFEFPDPDLGIYFGKTFSLYGYPPWQTSVTEFLNITSHHNISLSQFDNVIRLYSKCEQRLGK